MDQTTIVCVAGVVLTPLVYLVAIASAAGLSGVGSSSVVKGLIESIILSFISITSIYTYINLLQKNYITRIIGFDIALFYLLGFYTLFSYSLYTLGLNKMYREVLDPKSLSSYVASTSARLLIASTVLLYTGATAMFLLPPNNRSIPSESTALLGGAIVLLLISLYTLVRSSTRKTTGVARILSLALTVSSLELIAVSWAIRKGLLMDYTGAFIGAILFAVTLMVPILLFYSIQFSPEKLELIGLEAFYRGEEGRRDLETTVRLLLISSPLVGSVAGIIGLIASGLSAESILAVSTAIVSGLASAALVLSVGEGGLTGRVLPLAVWFAKHRFMVCLDRSLRKSDIIERSVVSGVARYLCEEYRLPLACID